MKTRNTYLRPLFTGLSVMALAATSASAATILSIDFGTAPSPVETGFIGQSATGVIHTTTEGNIMVSFSGQQGTFDRGAIAGTNQSLYRDFLFENSPGNNPDITITLSGAGISASTSYTLTFYAYDSADSSRRTGFIGLNGTTGTTLGPVASGATGQPDSLSEYAVTGTFTSNSSGILTFGVEGLPTGAERTVVNGFQLATIPEPSAALLGSLGVLCLLRRRR